jgi:AAA+ superfamily predicted ATPase
MKILKDRYDEPERGGKWEPITILLEGDGGSNKMNMASSTCL